MDFFRDLVSNFLKRFAFPSNRIKYENFDYMECLRQPCFQKSGFIWKTIRSVDINQKWRNTKFHSYWLSGYIENADTSKQGSKRDRQKLKFWIFCRRPMTSIDFLYTQARVSQRRWPHLDSSFSSQDMTPFLGSILTWAVYGSYPTSTSEIGFDTRFAFREAELGGIAVVSSQSKNKKNWPVFEPKGYPLRLKINIVLYGRKIDGGGL
jgi:hypothetical protein